MRCAKCNQEIPNAAAKFCPHCGAPVSQNISNPGPRPAGPGTGGPGPGPGGPGAGFRGSGAGPGGPGSGLRGSGAGPGGPGSGLRGPGSGLGGSKIFEGINLFYQMPANMNYSSGVIIWLWACIILYAFAGVYLMVSGRGLFLVGLFGILTAVAYFMLWFQRNVCYFYAICILALLVVLISFSKGLGATSLLGILIPLITSAVIKMYYFDYNQSGLINPSNYNLILSVVFGLANAVLVFGKWLELRIYIPVQFSLFRMATLINEIKDYFEFFGGGSMPVEFYIIYVIVIYFSIAAVVVCILEIVYLILVVINHPLQFAIGKRGSTYAISVAIMFILFIIIMAIIIYSKIDNNVWDIMHPTALPVISLAVSIAKKVNIKGR